MTTEAEERWWKLLRRAFGVPDIVSDHNRAVAVAVAVVKGWPDPANGRTQEQQFMSTEPDAQHKRVDDVSKVVALIAELGGQGKLDPLFYAAGPWNALRQRVMDQPGTDETKAIDEVFKVVVDRVNKHPFDDAGSTS